MVFKKYTVEQLVNLGYLEKPMDGNHGGKHPKSEDYVEKGIPFIMASDIINGSISYENCKFISQQTREKLDKGFARPGDVLLTHKATIGETAIVDDSYPEVVLTPQVTYYRTINGIDNRYLKYYFDSSFFQSTLKSWSESGSTRAYLGITNQLKLPVLLPDLETQKKIVRILFALDQKIELNNQQNETLFELGRQLYIEKFENNQTIDKVELGNFFPVITGKKDANASSENGKYPFFTCSKTISKIDDYVFDASAILLAGNGDFNVKFYRGKFDAYQRTYVLIPNNPEYLGFLYWAISYNLPTITANYRGSVIKFITKGNIENFKIPFADNELMPVFMKCLERIEKNNQQNEVLASLRNALLPKLMSGEINLNEATINE